MTTDNDQKMAILEGRLRHWDQEVIAAREQLAFAETRRQQTRRELEDYEVTDDDD